MLFCPTCRRTLPHHSHCPRAHDDPNTNSMTMSDGGFSRHLNLLAVLWFWITISGVFYVGLGHVLPSMYEGFSPGFFLLQHLLCYFMFLQMIVNWCLVKFVK